QTVSPPIRTSSCSAAGETSCERTEGFRRSVAAVNSTALPKADRFKELPELAYAASSDCHDSGGRSESEQVARNAASERTRLRHGTVAHSLARCQSRIVMCPVPGSTRKCLANRSG